MRIADDLTSRLLGEIVGNCRNLSYYKNIKGNGMTKIKNYAENIFKGYM